MNIYAFYSSLKLLKYNVKCIYGINFRAKKLPTILI